MVYLFAQKVYVVYRRLVTLTIVQFLLRHDRLLSGINNRVRLRLLLFQEERRCVFGRLFSLIKLLCDDLLHFLEHGSTGSGFFNLWWSCSILSLACTELLLEAGLHILRGERFICGLAIHVDIFKPLCDHHACRLSPQKWNRRIRQKFNLAWHRVVRNWLSAVFTGTHIFTPILTTRGAEVHAWRRGRKTNTELRGLDLFRNNVLLEHIIFSSNLKVKKYESALINLLAHHPRLPQPWPRTCQLYIVRKRLLLWIAGSSTS